MALAYLALVISLQEQEKVGKIVSVLFYVYASVVLWTGGRPVLGLSIYIHTRGNSLVGEGNLLECSSSNFQHSALFKIFD